MTARRGRSFSRGWCGASERRAAGLVLIALAAGAGGCAAHGPGIARGTDGLAPPTTRPATRPADDTDFLEMIEAQPLPTCDDGLRAILVLVDGECAPKTYEARLAECRRRGFVAARWKLAATDRLTRGTLAYMICKACRLRGGVNWYLFGNRRYAVREAVFRSLMPDGVAYHGVTGAELIAALNQADRYMTAHGLRAQPSAAASGSP